MPLVFIIFNSSHFNLSYFDPKEKRREIIGGKIAEKSNRKKKDK